MAGALLAEAKKRVQEVEIYFNFIGKYLPPHFGEVEMTPEEIEEMKKREARKDRLHQNYLKRKANGKQQEYYERTKAKKKAEMDAKKEEIRQEDIAKGVFVPVSLLPPAEPKKGAAKHRYCVYFITFQDLISQLKKAASENRLETRIKWFCRYKLLIIDELGYQKMDVDSANLFFNLIAKRYEKLSTVITTNSPFSKWSDIFQEPILTNALLDRLLHHCSVININGPSYRLKDQMQYMIEEN